MFSINIRMRKQRRFVSGRCVRGLWAGLYLAMLSSLILSVGGSQALGQSGRKPLSEERSAQEQRRQGGVAEGEDDVLRVRTEEVLLPVSVRDAKGLPVGGLGEESFFIYDNGVRQEIKSFNRRRIPANIVLLLDASGSVFGQMRFIREAAKGFIQGLDAQDKVSVMQFADKVELLQDWTSATDTAKLLKAVDWRYRPGESTAFYDGLYLAAREQLSKVEGRRLIIVLTDGIDSIDRRHASYKDALNAVRGAEATVYVVSLTASLRALVEERTGGGGGALSRILARGYDPRQVSRYLSLIDSAEKLLTGLAEQTGGRIFLPIKDEELSPAYSAIALELRTQYIITYQPRPKALSGTWRPIRVLVAPGGYEVASRRGYTVD
jgi:Ca-activated chloride channel family protein